MSHSQVCLHRTCAHRRTPGNPHLTSPTGHHDMAVGFLPGTRRTWTWRDHAPGMEGAIRSCAAGTLPDIQRPLLGPLQSQYYVSKACQHRPCVLQITNNVYKENSKHVLHFWFKLRNCLGFPDTRLHKKIIPSTGGMYRYKYKYEECVGVWTTRAIVPRSQGQGGVVLLLRSCLPFTCFLARPWSR